MSFERPMHLDFPLAAEKDEIRLLKLRPGTWDEPLQCQFWIVEISQKPDYVALSYVWGDATHSYCIQVDGRPLGVTENLYSALQRLRAHAHDREIVLWIDAICIYQGSISERNRQVAMMGRIYAHCREVWIWLGQMSSPEASDLRWSTNASESDRICYKFHGDESDYDEKWSEYQSAFPATERAGNNPSIAGEPTREVSSSEIVFHCAWILRLLAAGKHLNEIRPFSGGDTAVSEYLGRVLRSMEDLVNNEWFSRLWVVQEAVLAPSARVFFDFVSFPLRVIEDAKTLHAHTRARCCVPLGTQQLYFSEAIKNITGGFAEISQMQNESPTPNSSRTLFQL
ncbi:heterokaryon incompatibility protein-domain-containing protein [Clohesyomyces aquaticus]|uniref:Heterokaryon incompatibility protein-domain-containing protein n=1 Tax=Clohesyomyces aquaticus TaxID=1231657 RepID=A0A1Y2A525_9PLEO|nr:heterokaryon incompatibility protein-domain-containing protein [Clohesyomyces aquaticus]